MAGNSDSHEAQTDLPNETVSPPYWQTEHHDSLNSRARARSDASGKSPLISLVDNTGEESEQSQASWAKSAKIKDYVVVGGGLGSIGSYVVYNCVLETSNVSLISSVQYAQAD